MGEKVRCVRLIDDTDPQIKFIGHVGVVTFIGTNMIGAFDKYGATSYGVEFDNGWGYMWERELEPAREE
jgi:hypothetical protein